MQLERGDVKASMSANWPLDIFLLLRNGEGRKGEATGDHINGPPALPTRAYPRARRGKLDTMEEEGIRDQLSCHFWNYLQCV